jgi:hypothetical protein
MIADDYNAEHRNEYELRLGMMGLGPFDMPTYEQHDHAVAAPDAHIAALKLAKRQEPKTITKERVLNATDT